MKYFQANPTDLNERGRFFAIDIPRLLDIAMSNVNSTSEMSAILEQAYRPVWKCLEFQMFCHNCS